MTAANYAGLARFPLALLITAALCADVPWRTPAATVLIVAAILSDILDGVLSRHFRTVSRFGAVLDYTADKVFVCPVLFLLDPTDVFLLWCASLTVIREFLVMGIRLFAAGANEDIPASRLGKAKTIIMFPTLLLVVLAIPGGRVLLGIAVALAWVSAIAYARAAWHLLEPGLFPKRFPMRNS